MKTASVTLGDQVARTMAEKLLRAKISGSEVELSYAEAEFKAFFPHASDLDITIEGLGRVQYNGSTFNIQLKEQRK